MDNCLIIIGNGFDIQHGYATTYKEFSEKSNCTSFHKFRKFQEKYISPERISQTSWYDFESIINEITMKWFEAKNEAELIEDTKVRKKLLEEIKEINQTFVNIRLCLQEYIRKVTANNNGVILPSISNVFSGDARVITFNYSDIVERYTKNVVYMHGSIKEGTIIFGYPSRIEPDVIDNIATVFSKGKQRERLNYQRFLEQKGIQPCSLKGRRLLRKMDQNILSLFDLSGEYTYFSEMINEYGSQYDYSVAPINFGINLNEINELVIIGHGIQADIDIFDTILEDAEQLNHVVIFAYENESPEDLQRKKDFFSRPSITVETKLYR